MNQIDLNGQVAVVTGGAQGIGYAIAKRLVASGAKVSLWDTNAEKAAVSKTELGAADTQKVDITDVAGLEAALKATESALGPVQILVHSAAITGPNKNLDEVTPEEWRQTIEVCLNGTFYVNRLVVPGMKARNYGRIVNIASVAGKEGNPSLSPYSAAKAGVIGMVKSLGKELAKYDIAVNAITPATVDTPILAQVSQAHIDYMLSKIPMGRFGTVEELASIITWLASEECSFTTGAVFDISGGRATY